jgi:hypothetical protein
MPTKNEIARLRKVVTNLNKVLDELHQAQGTLYPEGLRQYREAIQKIIKEAQALSDKIKLPPTTGRKGVSVMIDQQDDLNLDDNDDEAA